MKKKHRSIKGIEIFLVFLFLLFTSIFAVSYLSSENVFDARITYVNNEKLPYSLLLEFDKFVPEDLDLDVEVLYEHENLVVASDSLHCTKEVCELKLELKKGFFDKHTVLITTKYDGSYYKKELNFVLDKVESKNQLFVDAPILFEIGKTTVISGNLVLETPGPVVLQTFSKKNQDEKDEITLNCISSVCPFELPITKNIIFGEYQLQAYLSDDTMSKTVAILEKKSYDKDQQKSLSNSTSINLTSLLPSGTQKVEVVDVFGNSKQINLSDNESTQGYIATGKDLDVEFKTQFTSLDSENEKDTLKKYVKKVSTKSISQAQSTASIKTQKEGILSAYDSGSTVALSDSSNPVVYEDEKIFIQGDDTYIDLNENKSLDTLERKIVPGIYKYQKIIRYKDGTETTVEDYFAYGLLTINTKKPLYHQNEVVETLLVVLDKWGYVVDNATIDLQITTPSGKLIKQSTQSGTIFETETPGVYQSSFLASELGKYSFYSVVQLDSMLVDVSSYVNVVEAYPFDILREVPATIDPWEGPFTNTFTVKPLLGYQGTYDFSEVFSSDIKINETDADTIKTENGTTILTWNSLQGTSRPFYTAQTPLVSPYLYYLGKSYVDYQGSTFLENRSWLFAIDPAAKVCGSTSPCICGASCTGGGEPGDGTIDTCTDGNTNWEWVDDIRITNLNGTYFGTGNTIEICVDFDCDTSGQGDRVTIGYKGDAVAWANGDVSYEAQCDATSIVTHCVNQTLGATSGTHFVRGKIVWAWNTETANRICSTRTYRDHDDLEFEVLERVGATPLQWDLDNGTTTGTGLNVTRGNNITAYAEWNKDLLDAVIEHNGNGSFENYSISTIVSNYTNITLDTSNIINFPTLGIVNITGITSWDFFFNLTNITSPAKYFNIYASLAINQSTDTPYLSPYIIYNGTSTTMYCQVVDDLLGISYSGRNVSFVNNVSGLLGTNTTNATGWAEFTFVENTIGNYDISCDVKEDLPNYYTISSNNNATKVLTVKANNTDITPPVILNVASSPSLFSIGGLTTISANVSDDINLSSVFLNVTLPNSSSFEYAMVEGPSDIYQFNFSQTTLDGIYSYFIRAEDNSSNIALSSTKTFEVAGIRTFIGIETTKKIYKIGETINLTSYVKTQTTDVSPVTEIGDTGEIYYSFDAANEWTSGGTGDQWARGVNAGSYVNQCDTSNCWGTNLAGNYNTNTNQWLESPAINFSGRTNVKFTYWRMLHLQENGDDALLESWDGAVWKAMFQDSTVPGNLYTLSAGTESKYPSEVEGVDDAKFRFRLATNGGGTARNGWGVDSVNITFTPREDWDKSFTTYTSSFGTNVSKVTAIKIGINVSAYDASGSDSLGTASPDVEVQIYNGTSYGSTYSCGLDSTKTYPFYCEIVIKNTPEYLDAWKTTGNRSIQVRVVGLDNSDSVTFRDIKREYITPSIIENHGIAQVTSTLLEQFKNSTGGVVQTMYNQSIVLNDSQTQQLSNYWNFSVPFGFTLGNYSSYVALTDTNGVVLQNEDDNTLIEDSYGFEVASLLIVPQTPLTGFTVNETFDLDILLDTSSYGSGGACSWYSTSTSINTSMNQINATHYNFTLNNIVDNQYDVKYFCNDTDNYNVESITILFNVSQTPRVSFIAPTDANASIVPRPWTWVNTSILDSSFNSSWIEWNGMNTSLACSFSAGITWNCGANISDSNGLYSYRVCANDSKNNIGCTELREITLNKSLPSVTILSPLNGTKTLYGSLTNITVNSSEVLSSIQFELNSNGTFFNFTNITTQLFENYLNLTTRYYNLFVFGFDLFGNSFNVSGNFYVLPDKHVKITKSIRSLGSNSYGTYVNISNFGNFEEYRFASLVPSLFTTLSQTQPPLVTSVFGSGTLYEFMENITIGTDYFYNETLNGTLDYTSLNLFKTSIK